MKPTATHETWPPAGSTAQPQWRMPGWRRVIWRGMRGRCPCCGDAKIFDGYLRVNAVCAACAAPLGEMPADDAPPYIAMLVVLHIAAFFIVLGFTLKLTPGLWQNALLLALLAGACALTLRMAKGAVIGILLKLGLKRGTLNG
jgi:uncharacterized protein (DUF983 family)